MKNKTETFTAMVTTSLAIFSMDSNNIRSAIVFGIISIVLLIHINVENNKSNNLKP